MRRRKSLISKGRATAVLAVIIIAVIVYAFLTFLEVSSPEGQWVNESSYIGRDGLISIKASDSGTGLGSVEVLIKKGGKSTQILFEDFSAKEPAIADFTDEIKPDFRKLGIKEGSAVLVLKVTDRSLWFSGNTHEVEYPVEIDTTPPRIGVISRDHVVLQGGSEAVVFKSSPDTLRAVVKIEGHTFPAYRGAFEDDDKFLGLFSYPYDIKPGKPVQIEAVDAAGNSRVRSLEVLVKPYEYRKRRIGLSDKFLETKVADLLDAAYIPTTGDLLGDFLLVNKDLRARNEAKIASVMETSTPELLWKGRFLQLKNSAVQSRFADFRTYVYKGRKVDKLYHLGVDLASVSKSTVGASNNGVVVFADDMGLYGNTVILDHGFGLFSLYGHLSTIDVMEGDTVKKGAEIGRTGSTGFAGGDHLHFGLYLHGTPVLPLEWWDGRWIRNRIMKKMKE
ncbi:MAG: M23 family metallopeptidase [Thermodesulfobacteriota bacterium]